MRDIKFRAWDKNSERMIELGSLDDIVADPEGHYELSFMLKNMVIMQSTGLKDKNNKEIFEGDIVKNGNILHKVYFDTFHASFQFFSPSQGSQECGYLRVEIVGNIFENELLLREGGF